MGEPFRVVDLADWTRGESEPGGAEEKRWFTAPEASPHAGHWLFKPRRIKELTLSRERRARGDAPDLLVRGEDWAEKISYELARLINVPAAETELATVVRRFTGESVLGSISRDMRPARWAWTPGAALLAERDDEFDSESCVGHTLTAVVAVLARLKGPVGTEFADQPAFDVFAGYLVLDALIANTDRHAHNWGVLQNPSTGALCLSPSFDHGSALSSGNGDSYRAERVKTAAVERWCSKGATKRFDGQEAVGLIDLAVRALSLATQDAQRYWRQQIVGLDLHLCNDVINAAPNLSDHTRTFVQIAVATNRKRLLDDLH
ncbi:HipA domain-containing protein [Rhodococcus sp. AW25M09]|uniref:HipA domain-containing protein n=1 Tax=Rhodococcus sp. AW25M09 TaxID=1268303 RepID=UPI0005B38879|nr:HipA domain-containing protein [Rhodococcus sp. AW25M09]